MKSITVRKTRRDHQCELADIRVVPIFRKTLDIEKLGRAVIALAEELVKQKTEVEYGKSA
jgi:hypothetical protein